MPEVNLSLLSVFKIQIMLALLFDKKSKSYTLLSNYARTYASTIELSLLEITNAKVWR